MIYAEENDPVLAKAGDYVIRKSAFDRLISYYTPDKQKSLEENPQQKTALIKQLIEAKIISDIARREGFDKRVDVSEKIQYLMNDYLFKEYLMKVVTKDVIATEEDQKQYYKLYKDKFSFPEQVKVRHILFKFSPNMSEEERKKLKERAEMVLERLKKGEDFAELAAEYSEDPGSAKKGGDLGYFQRGKMIKPFEEAAFSLKPGQLSEIVETRFGYHIIKGEDYKEAGTKTFNEVKDSIKAELQIELAKVKATEFIDKTIKDAGMEIYSDKITGEPEKAK
jgi:peptidyl-prolyl cis-trans isomerase C